MVLLDLRMEGRTGLSVLEELRGAGNDVPVLMLTGFATVDSAVAALKLGADDYLTKPCDNTLLRSKIKAILARREPVLGAGASRIVGTGQKMREVKRAIARVAPTESTVLLRGATGTGKELIARALHEESPRRSRPFVAVNCSALAEGLLESELFGHARGAFTGAVQERKGMFEEAHQRHPVPGRDRRRLARHAGQAAARAAGARGGARGHRAAGAGGRARGRGHAPRPGGDGGGGAFRKDLYFRLKVFQIRVPELKDRPEDVPALAGAALARWNERVEPHRRVTGICEEAMAVMQAYDWPGNVRELMTAVEYACIVCEGGRILAHHLPEEVREGATAGASSNGNGHGHGDASAASRARPSPRGATWPPAPTRSARPSSRRWKRPTATAPRPPPRSAWAAPPSGRSLRSTGCRRPRSGEDKRVMPVESGRQRAVARWRMSR